MSRSAFSGTFEIRENLENIKEKQARKNCVSREMKRLASTLQSFARRHYFDVNEVSIVFS